MPRLLFALFIIFLGLSAPSWAADRAPKKATTLSGGCFDYILCDAQATADASTACTCFSNSSTCTGPGTDNSIVLPLFSSYMITFDSTQSTASAYTCEIMTHYDGYTASLTNGSTPPLKIHPLANDISQAAPVLTIQGGLFSKIWARCPVIADNSVTIHGLVCPITR